MILHGASPVERAGELLPRLGDQDLKVRYEAKMDLQRLCLAAAAPGHEAERQPLALWLADQALRRDADRLVRLWLLRQIEYIGRAETLPALAALLQDEDPEVRECARRALERNPAPDAVRVLLDALAGALESGADARWRIGLVHSVGLRAAGSAVADRCVPLLERALADEATRDEAARALGHVGTPRAWQVLEDAMNRVPEAARALIEAARSAEPDQARELYEVVWRECIHRGPRAAALVGLAKLDPEGAAPLVREALEAPDPWVRHTALNAAEAMGGLGQDVLVEALPGVPDETAVQIVGRLGGEAQEALADLLAEPSEAVRLAAIQRLGEVGDAACVGPLLDRATAGSKDEAALARRALRQLGGRPVDRVLREVVSGAEDVPKAWRETALQALVDRNAPGVGGLLLELVRKHEELREPAIQGLARVGADDEFLPLAEEVMAAPSREGWRALEQIAARVENGPALAEALIQRADGDREKLRALLGTLARLGGAKAIE
ncbi:MAG: hypothetical protein D6766_11375, partial [Verrucomicrobia bacterium]